MGLFVNVGRWKHRTATVTAGENSQKVRGLTAGEREAFIESNKKRVAGEITGGEAARGIIVAGCVDPPVIDAEAATMPSDLHDACVAKILELSGLKDDDKSEKKEASPAS